MTIYNITRLYTLEQRKALAKFLGVEVRVIKIFYSDFTHTFAVQDNQDYRMFYKTICKKDIAVKYAYNKMKDVPIKKLEACPQIDYDNKRRRIINGKNFRIRRV